MSRRARKPIPRWRSLLSLRLGLSIWLLNAFEVATRFRSMGLLEGLTAGMILFVGPFLILESLRDLQNAPAKSES